MPCYTPPASREFSVVCFEYLQKGFTYLNDSDIAEIMMNQENTSIAQKLCLLCQKLTPAQVCSIEDPHNEYQDLYRWYMDHLMFDVFENKENKNIFERCSKEAKRFWHEITINEKGSVSNEYVGF